MGSQTEDRTIREHARALLTPSVGTGKRPCLTVLAGGPSGTVYTLAAEQATVVGRAPDAGLRFEDRRVSRHHAKVMAGSEGNTVLEDLGSSNGTFVNGTRIQSQVLKDGDKIQIGPSAILKFSYQDDVDRSFQQELAERGIKDGLTGIYTEQYFLDRIASEYAHARRHEGTLALLIFEIDHFKNINDTHGVRAGDFILRELARVVSQMLRAEDVFARYGNVSFVVLARDIGDAGVAVLAQRIGRTIKGHEFVFEDTQIPVTISFGIATLSDKAKKPAKLIQIADKYLSRAKKAGQNAIGGRVVKGLAQRNGASTAVPYSKKNRAGGIMSLFDRLTRLLQKRPTPH